MAEFTSQDYRKFHKQASGELEQLEKWQAKLVDAPTSIKEFVDLQIHMLIDDMRRYENHFTKAA